MKTRKADTLYCGVDELKIKKAEPQLNWENMDHFKRFVMDRYRVHKRKDVKELDPPWTKNPILKEFKFTNVRREHDRQTRYLIENISDNDNLSLEDKIINSTMFRAWNNWSTLKDFGFPYTSLDLYAPDLKETVRPTYQGLLMKQPDRLWYSNAFNQGGIKVAWKYSDPETKEDLEPDIPLRPFHIGPYMDEHDIADRLLDAADQEEVFEILSTMPGFGEFMAYQVFVDLTYIEDFPFSENEFTIAGPGCKRGLDLIFEDKDGMNYEECIFWLRDKINESPSIFNRIELHSIHKKDPISYNPVKLFSDLPKYDRCMNVMSIENCMCELSKYVRTANGTGRPRNKYKYKEPKDEI